MTGFLNSGDNPLSALTSRPMGDLGYVIDDRAATGTSSPDRTRGRLRLGRPANPATGTWNIARREQLITPVAAIE